MAIKLINDQERLLWVFPEDKEVKITYRRIPDSLRQQWREELKDTATGQVNNAAVGAKGLEYALLGWDGITDRGNIPVDCTVENFSLLPDGVTLPFMDVLLSGLPAKEDPAKN